MTRERQAQHSYAGPVGAGRVKVSRGKEAGLVPEEEGHRFEEGQGIPEQEAGLVPEEEGHRFEEGQGLPE